MNNKIARRKFNPFAAFAVSWLVGLSAVATLYFLVWLTSQTLGWWLGWVFDAELPRLVETLLPFPSLLLVLFLFGSTIYALTTQEALRRVGRWYGRGIVPIAFALFTTGLVFRLFPVDYLTSLFLNAFNPSTEAARRVASFAGSAMMTTVRIVLSGFLGVGALVLARKPTQPCVRLIADEALITAVWSNLQQSETRRLLLSQFPDEWVGGRSKNEK